MWRELERIARLRRRVTTESETGSSRRKKVDTVTSRRLSTCSDGSERKEGANQKTLEQRPVAQTNNPSLCKIKKRLAKKSRRSDPDNRELSKHLLKMLNDNNLTVKVRRKGSKKPKKSLKTGLRQKSRKKNIKSKMFNGRKTVTSIFREQRSQPTVPGEKAKKSRLVGSHSKSKRFCKRNQTLYSFKKSRKKTVSISREKGGRPLQKFSFLDQERLRHMRNGQFVKSFSNQKLLSLKDRKQSHSTRMQSLRRGTQNDLLRNQLKHSRSVKEIKKNFSLRHSSQSRSKPKHKAKFKVARQRSKRTKRGTRSLQKKELDFLCKGCEIQSKAPDKVPSKSKRPRRTCSSKTISLRKNFSNFQFNRPLNYISKNKSMKMSNRILRTEKPRTKAKSKVQSQSRPITWVPGAHLSKRPKKESLQTYYSPSIPAKNNFAGLSKKFSVGGPVAYSKRLIRNAAYYNSMHLNASPEMLLRSKPAQDCPRDKGSFLTNSLLKRSSVLGQSKKKKHDFDSKRASKANLKSRRQNISRGKFSNHKPIKSRPILKELVRQLKENDSLQLEILKTLGCKISRHKSSKKTSKRGKSRAKTKGSFKGKSKSKPKSRPGDPPKSRAKKSKLEKLRNLNRLISRDKLQVSRLKNEIEKGSLKGSKVQSRAKSKKKSKRSRVKLTLQASLLPPTALLRGNQLKPSTEHEVKSIGFVSEPFSLQNHQVFQCQKPLEMSKFAPMQANQALDLTSLRLGNKAFSKKAQMNTVYILPEQDRRKFKAKENIPTKLRTAKKSRRQNFHYQSPMLVRIGSASSLKPKLLGSGTQNTSPAKKRVMRDEDIKHHMNIILTNDLNLERRKPKKRKRIFN